MRRVKSQCGCEIFWGCGGRGDGGQQLVYVPLRIHMKRVEGVFSEKSPYWIFFFH